MGKTVLDTGLSREPDSRARDAGIHGFPEAPLLATIQRPRRLKAVDGRVEPGHDDGRTADGGDHPTGKPPMTSVRKQW